MGQALLGRVKESGAVRAFLERADGPVTLLLEGEPGIGKTALWAEGVEHARSAGFTVLVSRPAESEVRLSFAALADLLEPVSEDVYLELPAAQREAIDAALVRGERSAGRADLRSVAAALRGILLALAGSAPVLLAIDDLQWLDDPSATALGFALRRVGDAPVRLLATQRAGADAQALGDHEVLRLEPLTVAAVHQLLKDRLGCTLPRPVLMRVHQVCAGNPFHALEIGRELLEAGVGPGDALPVPQDLRRLLRRRLGRLSAGSRDALLALAATSAPSHSLLARVLERDPTRELDEAEDAGVLEIDGDSLRFSHPLYAAGIYGGAPPERRREVHRRLADAAEDIEERARHLGLSADAPSEEVAQALEAGASQARARGATGAAAQLYARAAQLTPLGSQAAVSRLRSHAECLFEAGDTPGAVAALERLVDESRSGDERAEALLLLATTVWFDDHERALALGRGALAEARGKRLRGLIHARLSWLDHGTDETRAHACAALELLDEHEDPEIYAFALLNRAANDFHSGRRAQELDIERGRALQGHDLRWDYSTIPACWLKEMDRLDDARAEFELYVRRARELGDDSSLTTHLVHLAEISLWLGEWDRAEQEARESAELAEQTGQRAYLSVVEYANALVDAHRGRLDEALARLERGEAFAHLTAEADVFVQFARGFVELGRDDYAAAERAFAAAAAHFDARGIVEPARWRFDGDHLEAVIRLGDLERSEELLTRLRRRGQTAPRPWLLGAIARGEALLLAARGDVDGAIAAGGAAVRHHEAGRLPFELARDWLVKGQVERRAKRKAAAKASLSRALAIFEELGAPLWAEKARRELSRIGLRPPARDDLTETERQVAELAASGLKNREVAAKLFLSPKTVDANLARVYRKLGIRSRAELGAKLGSSV